MPGPGIALFPGLGMRLGRANTMNIDRPPANHSHAVKPFGYYCTHLKYICRLYTSSGCFNNTVDSYLVDMPLSLVTCHSLEACSLCVAFLED